MSKATLAVTIASAFVVMLIVNGFGKAEVVEPIGKAPERFTNRNMISYFRVGQPIRWQAADGSGYEIELLGPDLAGKIKALDDAADPHERSRLSRIKEVGLDYIVIENNKTEYTVAAHSISLIKVWKDDRPTDQKTGVPASPEFQTR
jgi:hypothetical protein